MGAREDMIGLITRSGWELDETATIAANRYGRERKQNPHAFIRKAAHGGQWEITLNYSNNASFYGSYDDRLRALNITYRDDEGEEQAIRVGGNYKGDLVTPGKYDSHNGLYDALGPGTLRDRVKRLIADPDVAVWLGAQNQYVYIVKRQAEWDTDNAIRRQKEGPLKHVALGGGAHDFASPWKNLGHDLYYPAKALEEAHGLTDVVGELVKVHAALEAMLAALTPEGREAYMDKLVEAHGLTPRKE